MSPLEEVAVATAVALIEEQIRATDDRIARLRAKFTEERDAALEEQTELIRRRNRLNECLEGTGRPRIALPGNVEEELPTCPEGRPVPERDIQSFADSIGLEAFGTAKTGRPSAASTTTFRASDVTRLLNEGKKTK